MNLCDATASVIIDPMQLEFDFQLKAADAGRRRWYRIFPLREHIARAVRILPGGSRDRHASFGEQREGQFSKRGAVIGSME
jgi:hypothetical protein